MNLSFEEESRGVAKFPTQICEVGVLRRSTFHAAAMYRRGIGVDYSVRSLLLVRYLVSCVKANPKLLIHTTENNHGKTN